MRRWIFGVSILMSFSQTAFAQDSLSPHIYLENQEEIQVFAPKVLSNGARALAPYASLSEESTLSIDVRNAYAALSAAQTNPERVNFPFVTDAKSTQIQRNNTGWVCGMRIVDITDEDLRESVDMERTDLCISKETMAKMTAMESNEELNLEAYQTFAANQDISRLSDLARRVDFQEEQEDAGLLHPIAAGDVKLGSPIRGCATGCLTATSEFGMRNHPVLKKRRLHKGIDLRASIGTAVVSSLDGKVLANRTERSASRGRGKKRTGGKISGYGHYVIVVHEKAGMQTLYAHLSSFKSKAGASVKQGDLIALSGNTGIGTAPHLHFETHVAGKKGSYSPTNPRKFISSMLGTVASFFKLFIIHA